MTRRIPFLVAFFAGIFAIVLHAGPAAGATEKVLYSFVPYLNGRYPSTTITDAEGNLYVVAEGGAHRLARACSIRLPAGAMDRGR
jgi:hypothetical protein